MKLTIYRILSFLLLPMALLFSITVLFFIRAAFANPAMLLPLFIVACVTVYSFASLNFLIKGIDSKKFLGRSAKDWLKVNAIVSIIFSVMMISQCIIFILHPEMLQSIAAQAKQNAGSDLKVPEASFENYLRVTSYFFLVYAIVLFIHSVCKKRNYFFVKLLCIKNNYTG